MNRTAWAYIGTCFLILTGCSNLTESAAPTTTLAPTTVVSTIVPIPVTAPPLGLVDPPAFRCDPFTIPSSAFASGDAVFRGDTQVLRQVSAELERVARVKGLHPTVAVTGHTDSVPTKYLGGNQGLSEARAQSVINELVKLGVPEVQIEPPLGMADTKPVPGAPSGPEGNAMNRRVEVRLVCPGQAQ